MKHYNYIFAGGGLSALMTALRMVESGKFSGRTILLADPDRKQLDDRTWCFWDYPTGEWEKLVSKRWEKAIFKGADYTREFDLNPYVYNHINSIDFYEYVREVLSAHANIDFVYERVEHISELSRIVEVIIGSEAVSCDKLISSIFSEDDLLEQNKYPYLKQHFIGWFVRSEKAIFDSGKATFMDFSIEQRGNTRFMYVLPFSETEALVEYTLFSKVLLEPNEYETAIAEYLRDLGVEKYQIVRKESGSIPMTAYPFWRKNTKNIVHIGQAGGWTKASTGFTFKNAARLSLKLSRFLATDDPDLSKFHRTDKFWLYDLLLLDILNEDNSRGQDIFSAMFESGNPALIFKFLDEDSSLAEDLSIILRCPKRPFIKAVAGRLFK